jgi:hypothetical protein
MTEQQTTVVEDGWCQMKKVWLSLKVQSSVMNKSQRSNASALTIVS